jgi:hypothetical protein
MKIEESARKLERISTEFEDVTQSFKDIFSELEITREITPAEGSIQTDKYAAAAVVLSEIRELMQQAANPDEITVAVQLAKIQDKIRIGLPGGAVMSQQELAWTRENPGEEAPGNLFYQLAQDQLQIGDGMAFTYDLDEVSDSFTASLRKTLKRELGEEIGDIASEIELGEFLLEKRVTTLATLELPDANVSERIAKKFKAAGVTCDEEGRLHGIYTNVTEKVAIAHGPVKEIEEKASDTEEAKGMRVKSFQELLELAKRTAESTDTYKKFRVHYPDRPEWFDGVRNPSFTWGLSLAAERLKHYVLRRDTYKEGARMSQQNTTRPNSRDMAS